MADYKVKYKTPSGVIVDMHFNRSAAPVFFDQCWRLCDLIGSGISNNFFRAHRENIPDMSVAEGSMKVGKWITLISVTALTGCSSPFTKRYHQKMNKEINKTHIELIKFKLIMSINHVCTILIKKSSTKTL